MRAHGIESSSGFSLYWIVYQIEILYQVSYMLVGYNANMVKIGLTNDYAKMFY